jgi:hypothetical protein
MKQTKAEAELALLNRIAELLRRGAPMGEIGRDLPSKPEREPRNAVKPESLVLASGLLDDERRPLTPRHSHYGLFRHVLRWQDTWSDDEHSSFWQGGLALWPLNRGKRSHKYALAYALVIALEGCVDLDEFLCLLSSELRTKAIKGLTAEEFTLPDLQRRDVVRIALEMIAAPRHLYPDSGRLPRVVTGEESAPWLAVAHVPLEAHSAEREASSEIVRAAERVVERAGNPR